MIARLETRSSRFRFRNDQAGDRTIRRSRATTSADGRSRHWHHVSEPPHPGVRLLLMSAPCKVGFRQGKR